MGARRSAFFGAMWLVAGGGATMPATLAPQQDPPSFRMAVAATPDSVVKLAKFALGSVRGAIQPPRIQRDFIMVATEYSQPRPNGGHTQITILAAIHRQMTKTTPAYTRIDLSAWGIDVHPTDTRLALPPGSRGGASDLPTLTTTTPMATSSSQRQPYRITRGDSAWVALEEVLDAFVEFGNARLPKGSR